MLKGCQREMVVVKGDSDSVFESAYFLLKKSHSPKSSKKEDIVECANSIINENSFASLKKRRFKTALLGVACFLFGVVFTLTLVLIL